LRNGKRNRIRSTRDEKIFQAFNVTFLTLFALCCLLPLINLFAKAVSSETAVVRGEVFLLPVGFQLESVGFMLSQRGFRTAFVNSVFVTAAGTALHLAATVAAAYALSRRRLKGRRAIQFVIIFTMLFSGGVIPTFIVMQNLGLMESLWAVILPGVVNPFMLIIMRNYFENIPDSLEESAKIDGASNARALRSVMLPLALPAVATLCVFAAVAYWNDYFGPLMYLHKRENFTLQLYLRQLLAGVGGTTGSSGLVNGSQLRALRNKSPMIVQASAVFLSTIPILIVYPFLQKYFVRGMTLGAVKG
jgi:putative aldouronate transport system permease protein